MDSATVGLGAGEEKQVQLGLPGAWAVDNSEPSDHYTTKIGGRPDWPPSLPPGSLLRDGLLKCAVCGGCLVLVAQVYAPLTLPHGKQWTERTIYILGCPAPGCGVDAACWRTIRLQKESTGNVTVPAGGVQKISESCVAEEASDSWDEDNLWGADNQDGEVNATENLEGLMDMNELASALMETGRAAAGSAVECRRSNRDKRVGGIMSGTGGRHEGSDVEAGNHNFELPVLPCFYVYFQAESIPQRNARSSPSSSSAFPSGTAQIPTSPPVEENGDSRRGHWEEEEYEPDRALYVDRTYLRFKKRLDRNPDQCLRYCYNGDVLRAVSDEARGAPGKCVGCGGPRLYEMQLMPPLLYFLQQAFKQDSAPASCPLDEWDWFTLIVCTCAESCSQKADEVMALGEEKAPWNIVEEAIVLQQEATRIRSADLSE